MTSWKEKMNAVLSEEIRYSPYIQLAPLITNETALQHICRLLKQQYDSMPTVVEVPVIQVNVGENIQEIPLFRDPLLGEDINIPEIIPDKEEISRARHGKFISEEKMAILNLAVSFGCKWATREINRLAELV